MVNTRSRASANRNQATKRAEQAIARGGNRALRQALGIKPRRARKAVAKESACASQEREIQRLQKIIAELKAGLQRARARGARVTNEYMNANLHGGLFYDPVNAWRESQVTEVESRRMWRARNLKAKLSKPYTPPKLQRNNKGREYENVRVGDWPPKKRAMYGWNKLPNNTIKRIYHH